MPTAISLIGTRSLDALTPEEALQCALLGVRVENPEATAVFCHYKHFTFYPVEYPGRRCFYVTQYRDLEAIRMGSELETYEYEDLLSLIEAIDAI